MSGSYAFNICKGLKTLPVYGTKESYCKNKSATYLFRLMCS